MLQAVKWLFSALDELVQGMNPPFFPLCLILRMGHTPAFERNEAMSDVGKMERKTNLFKPKVPTLP